MDRLAYSYHFLPSVRWRKLRRHIVLSRRTGVAGLATPVPPRMVSQVQLHLGWRARWRRPGHDLHTLLCCLRRLGRLAAIPRCEWGVMHAKLLGLGLTASCHSGQEILPKETSIAVTEMVLSDEALGDAALNVTTPWE